MTLTTYLTIALCIAAWIAVRGADKELRDKMKGDD